MTQLFSVSDLGTLRISTNILFLTNLHWKKIFAKKTRFRLYPSCCIGEVLICVIDWHVSFTAVLQCCVLYLELKHVFPKLWKSHTVLMFRGKQIKNWYAVIKLFTHFLMPQNSHHSEFRWKPICASSDFIEDYKYVSFHIEQGIKSHRPVLHTSQK